MKKIKVILLLIPCLILLTAQRSKASHAVGADITYAYAGPNQYMVTVKFYRDCSGITAPTSVDIYYDSDTCGIHGPNNYVTINLIPNTGHEIPTGAYNPCYRTSCNGGVGYGVQEYIYRGLVTVPTTCPDWTLSVEINARNNGITTILNPGGSTLRVQATLDNVHNAIDTSAVFSTYPVSRFCINRTFHYSQGAIDTEGDSLIFSLVDALDAGGTIVNYVNPPYNGLNPISSSIPITIDPHTGVITFAPNMIQIGIFAILVQEYRNGVLIGTIRRDMQVNIESTCNEPPFLHTSTINGSLMPGDTIQAACGDSIIYVKMSAPVHCSSVASDGSDFRMLSPSGLPIPITREVAINCVNGLTDSIEVHLYSGSSLLTENGYYYLWSKRGNDGNTLTNDCGQELIEYDTTKFFFNSCFNGKVDLTNVSVDAANNNMEVYWTPPANLPVSQFRTYDIYRSETPNGTNYTKIDTINSATASFYLDTHVEVPVRPYNYSVAIHLNNGHVCPGSDSIQSIFLSDGGRSTDSLIAYLHWTSYWGWPNAHYRVMQSSNNGSSFFEVTSASTGYTYTSVLLPDTPKVYLYRIHTFDPSGNLLSRSNWIPVEVTRLDVKPTNVLTPNGDGQNDAFIFNGLESYPGSKLKVFNRWGILVYENGNYKNDWKGGDLKDGVYYYTLKVANTKSTELRGTVNIIHGK